VIDPFEEVAPVPEIDRWQEFTARLARSMMWDMIGPQKMQEDPMRFGQNPASMDVLEAEAEDMWKRKHSLMPFGMIFPAICYAAIDSASTAIIMSEEFEDKFSPDELFKFRMNNLKLGTSIAESVVGHLLEKGLVKYGDNNVILGE